jgi:HEAT repeat protein
MKCEQYEELFTGWMNNELTPAEREKLEQHLTDCDSCSAELAAMQQIWEIMDDVKAPEPSARMQTDFRAMLNDYKANEIGRKGLFSSIKDQLSKLWQLRQRWPLAYNLAIILISFGCGYLFFHKSKGGEQEQQLKELTSQVHELKQTMMLALLENPSASERIRGVSYTTEIKHADKEVIDALLATLNNDPNVNVRLSTLDALTHLANHPEVREGLVKSITQQDSPLMQSAIADVMLKLQERSSVKSFKELLKQKNLDNGVRDKIKQTITELI